MWARCGQCGAELKESDKECPKCDSTRKAFGRKASTSIAVKIVETTAKQKREGFRRFMKQMISRWRPSRSPELKDGVNEERIIDKEKDEYHHTVKDARTREVTHDEHEPLSQHKNQSKHL